MKTIIAGGRDYELTARDYARLDELPITQVVSGGARGADRCGENWAARRGIPCRVFPADWDRFKKAAGALRNQQMAEYAEAAVLFPGGTGTADMFSRAVRMGLVVYDYRYA